MSISILKFLTTFLILASCASQSTQSDKKLAGIYFRKGTQDLVIKDYTSALDNLLKAAQNDPNNAEIHNNLAMAYMFKNREADAMAHLKKALILDPKNTDAKINIATIYLNGNELAKAKAIYEESLSSDLTYKGHFRTYYNLGIIAEKSDQTSAAIKYFKASIKEASTYCPAQLKLGDYETQTRNYAGALSYYKAASQGSCSNDPLPHYQQALAYLSLKQYDNAQFKFKEIISRFPNSEYRDMAKDKLSSFQSLMNQSEKTAY